MIHAHTALALEQVLWRSLAERHEGHPIGDEAALTSGAPALARMSFAVWAISPAFSRSFLIRYARARLNEQNPSSRGSLSEVQKATSVIETLGSFLELLLCKMGKALNVVDVTLRSSYPMRVVQTDGILCVSN